MLNGDQENMPVTYRFGLKTLFDGCLITVAYLCVKPLTISDFLFDDYLIKEKS